jgi:hypothetical protein
MLSKENILYIHNNLFILTKIDSAFTIKYSMIKWKTNQRNLDEKKMHQQMN